MKRRDLLRIPVKRIKTIFSDKEESDHSHNEEDKKVDLFSTSDLSNALSSDFNINTLRQELMRMGIDPTNYSEQEMLDLVVSEMQKVRPSQG